MRRLRFASVLIAASVSGCVGSTSLRPTHPLIAADGTADSAKVYFIRPDQMFGGVMDMPLTISLGGTELLTLAKGQYTLIPLVPGRTEMKVESYTVGNPGTMTLVSTLTPWTFSPGETRYVLFEMVPRDRGFQPQGLSGGSEFFPRTISKDLAVSAVRRLTPAGMAIDQPI